MVLAAAMVFGCAATGPIRPFQNGENVKPETEGEIRLWHAAQRIESRLKRSGQIYSDPNIRIYLQGVMDRLYPEYQGKIKVEILKAPVLNAFALPNGAVYVNTGLIAAMENEAQMATVLAHEGIHFVNKHSALQRRNYHSTVGVSWAVALLGIPFLPDLISASSIFGYSQELENEADKLGYARLQAAGYDVRQAPKTFQHLALEAKANKVPEPFFFSTHPKLEKRIQHFEALNAAEDPAAGRIQSETYQDHVANLRPEVLKGKITAGKYNAVITVLTHEDLLPLYGDYGRFYLAEAYRLRDQEGDLSHAVTAYEALVSQQPGFAPVHKSLGMVYLKTHRYKKAADRFENYLELEPNAKDSAFVRQYLKQARIGAGLQ